MAKSKARSVGFRGVGLGRTTGQRTALSWLALAITPLAAACGSSATRDLTVPLANGDTGVVDSTVPDVSWNVLEGGVDGGACIPRTCASAGANSGPVADGCGALLSCGTCSAPEICGGGGTASVCGNSVGGCTPLTCAKAGANCGPIGDGCGGTLDCGTCPSDQSCGGAGTPSVCGVKFIAPDGGVADAANTCKPRTCADAGANCGPIGDGCGGSLNCGSCAAPFICGGAGTPSVCGNPYVGDGGLACTPRTCADVGANCGPVGDGCGGLLDCGACSAPYICGGGGTPSVCGNPYVGDGGAACTPRTCADIGANCGSVGDGCGALLDCGTCSAPFICGGGGTASRCGNPYANDAGVVCTPKTCASAGANCGLIGDGCGGSLDCGTCLSPYICGGAGTPSVCGNPFASDAGVVCTPRTCASVGANCGPVGDGCGGLLDCGTCASPYLCGGGGKANVCGNPYANDAGVVCTPKTCASTSANCGWIGDGCGGSVNCGTCASPDICGGGGVPNRCGGGSGGGGSSTCTGLCLQQIACPTAGVTTTISGTVYAPTDASLGFGAADPLPNAVVYIPKSGTPTPFASTVTCDQCGGAGTTNALVSAITGPDGKFQLKNVPVGANIPIVIELGKWRRYYSIPNVSACVDTPLPATATRLPRKQAETSAYDNIPQMAFVTGAVDALECVMRKIGVSDTEFTVPSKGGRVHLYAGDGSAGATLPGTPTEATLVGSATTLQKYDVVLFPCQGARYSSNHASAAQQTNVINYTNAGGRVFATHFSYVWLYNDAPFSGTAAWNVDQASPADQTGFLDTSFPKGALLAQWLQLVGASTAYAQIPLKVLRHDYNSVVAPSQSWMTINNPGASVHYTFNTPVGTPAASQCGRVLFDDFHVEDTQANGKTFPAECTSTPMTPQEKLLEFMIFDLSSCVTADNAPPPPPPTCTPGTCATAHASCGPVGDGCGGLLQCGTCPSGQTCGGGGVANQCGGPSCTPTSCTQLGYSCGNWGDGCGASLSCGTCPAGTSCGGGGVTGVCGGPTCTAQTCASLKASCGWVADGCGGLLQCGTCPTGQSCGGAGVANQCGGPTCTPTTCSKLGYTCGAWGDGCGGALACGSCPVGTTCGGGGVTGVCGGPTCSPQTCSSLKAACGYVGDGCGAAINCGPCPAGTTCGGGGVANQCGGPTCKPLTCASVGATCGWIGDGCGGSVNCGDCVAPDTCGGAGTPNTCGHNTTGGCTKLTCAGVGAGCGPVADGCGGLLDCGPCPSGQTCGGGGVSNQCGGPTCTPTTCSALGFNCGQAGDGCGGLLDCGTCTAPQTCGGGGVTNVCGNIR
jgi:hypothetical protein